MDLVPLVLPNSLLQRQGPCEKRPDDFMDGFELPAHFRKPLHEVYPETIHNDMEFLEEEHLYVSDINGMKIPASDSVTKFAHDYQEHFDGKLAISLMKRSTKKKWPRLEYVINPQKVEKDGFKCEMGCMITVSDVTVSVMQPNSTFGLEGETIYNLLKQIEIKNDSESSQEEEYYVFERTMTDDEILYKWERNGLLKRNMGTAAHRNCELALEGLPYRWYDPEMKAFFTFIKDYIIPNGATIMSTEREIRSFRLDIAGSVDAVFKMPDESIVVVDWKLSDKLYMNMTGFKKMMAPLNHLDDCDGAGYALQTSIYQYLFEKEYGYTVSERILVSLSPENPFITSVPYLKNEVKYIMEKQEKLVEARNSIQGFKCEITGKTLVKPVKCEDGRTVSEKVALLHKLKYTHDVELSKQLDEEINKIIVPVVFDNTGTQNWKKIMPKHGGIRPFS
tara:strand:+ start:898 stop:2244 length:1347 start_codon:yes stop_codon:yes gene_type:complete